MIRSDPWVLCCESRWLLGCDQRACCQRAVLVALGDLSDGDGAVVVGVSGLAELRHALGHDLLHGFASGLHVVARIELLGLCPEHLADCAGNGQDQSHNPGNSLTRRDWNIQVNYLFDWHQGLEWKDLLQGKTQ